MRILIIVLIAFAITEPVSAQTSNDYAKFDRLSLNLNEVNFDNQTSFGIVKTRRHWHRLKTSGVIVTGIGAACATLGVFAIGDGNEINAFIADRQAKNLPYRYDDNDGDKAILTGVLGVAGGITALAGGITMWAIGGSRLKKLKNVSFSAGPKSAVLVIRF